MTGFTPSDLTIDFNYEELITREAYKILKSTEARDLILDFDVREGGLTALLRRVNPKIGQVLVHEKALTIRNVVKAILTKRGEKNFPLFGIPREKLPNTMLAFPIKRLTRFALAAPITIVNTDLLNEKGVFVLTIKNLAFLITYAKTLLPRLIRG